jgi:hypothetical protein
MDVTRCCRASTGTFAGITLVQIARADRAPAAPPRSIHVGSSRTDENATCVAPTATWCCERAFANAVKSVSATCVVPTRRTANTHLPQWRCHSKPLEYHIIVTHTHTHTRTHTHTLVHNNNPAFDMMVETQSWTHGWTLDWAHCCSQPHHVAVYEREQSGPPPLHTHTHTTHTHTHKPTLTGTTRFGTAGGSMMSHGSV